MSVAEHSFYVPKQTYNIIIIRLYIVSHLILNLRSTRHVMFSS